MKTQGIYLTKGVPNIYTKKLQNTAKIKEDLNR